MELPCPGPRAVRRCVVRRARARPGADGQDVRRVRRGAPRSPARARLPLGLCRRRPDPLRAVQGGARLFSSPDLPEHPLLARYAIVSPGQLNRAVPRYADDWVTSLSPEQVGRYSVVFDTIARCAEARGRAISDVVCEVLSTLPFPLGAVLERHGLGRFRVTQKADLDNPKDVYRSENAAPADWIMVGTHDTPPLWRLLDTWGAPPRWGRQAACLATRLAPSPAEEGAMARALASDPRALAQAKLADLFASRASNVMVFFADLLGMKEIYNTPGTVGDHRLVSAGPPRLRAVLPGDARARRGPRSPSRARARAARAGRRGVGGAREPRQAAGAPPRLALRAGELRRISRATAMTPRPPGERWTGWPLTDPLRSYSRRLVTLASLALHGGLGVLGVPPPVSFPTVR